MELRMYGDPGTRRRPGAKIAYWIASRFALKEVTKVIREDLAVLPSIQKGLQSPDLPNGGLISVREERIHHFQKAIQSTMYGAPDGKVALDT